MSTKISAIENIFCERLASLMAELGYVNRQQSKFAQDIDIPQSTLNEVLKGKKEPKLKLLISITNKFQNVNLNWLITGQGEMFLQEPVKQTNNVVLMEHLKIIPQFKNPELAKEINFGLLELESMDESQMLVVKGVIEGIRLTLMSKKQKPA